MAIKRLLLALIISNVTAFPLNPRDEDLAVAKFSRILGIRACNRNTANPYTNVNYIRIINFFNHFHRKGNVDARIFMSVLILGVLDILLSPPPLPMPVHTIDTASKSKVVTLLHAHFKLSTIASTIHCHPSTVYRWEGNVQRYGYLNPPYLLPRGRPRAVHIYTNIPRSIKMSSRCSLQKSRILLYIS